VAGGGEGAIATSGNGFVTELSGEGGLCSEAEDGSVGDGAISEGVEVTGGGEEAIAEAGHGFVTELSGEGEARGAGAGTGTPATLREFKVSLSRSISSRAESAFATHACTCCEWVGSIVESNTIVLSQIFGIFTR
jgi:hypothetical protein